MSFLTVLAWGGFLLGCFINYHLYIARKEIETNKDKYPDFKTDLMILGCLPVPITLVAFICLAWIISGGKIW